MSLLICTTNLVVVIWRRGHSVSFDRLDRLVRAAYKLLALVRRTSSEIMIGGATCSTSSTATRVLFHRCSCGRRVSLLLQNQFSIWKSSQVITLGVVTWVGSVAQVELISLRGRRTLLRNWTTPLTWHTNPRLFTCLQFWLMLMLIQGRWLLYYLLLLRLLSLLNQIQISWPCRAVPVTTARSSIWRGNHKLRMLICMGFVAFLVTIFSHFTCLVRNGVNVAVRVDRNRSTSDSLSRWLTCRRRAHRVWILEPVFANSTPIPRPILSSHRLLLRQEFSFSSYPLMVVSDEYAPSRLALRLPDQHRGFPVSRTWRLRRNHRWRHVIWEACIADGGLHDVNSARIRPIVPNFATCTC